MKGIKLAFDRSLERLFIKELLRFMETLFIFTMQVIDIALQNLVNAGALNVVTFVGTFAKEETTSSSFLTTWDFPECPRRKSMKVPLTS
ncbi:MAG: hypothetical protein LUD17_00310 [Bacteroidales bacterium]|nr:hypothetical protein [Bacteroidales bacterium]